MKEQNGFRGTKLEIFYTNVKKKCKNSTSHVCNLCELIDIRNTEGQSARVQYEGGGGKMQRSSSVTGSLGSRGE